MQSFYHALKIVNRHVRSIRQDFKVTTHCQSQKVLCVCQTTTDRKQNTANNKTKIHTKGIRWRFSHPSLKTEKKKYMRHTKHP